MTDQAAAASEIRVRLEDVRDRIREAGGNPHEITIVAVTKGFGVDAVRAVEAAGLGDVGENYAQDLLAKRAEGGATIRWHFIGPIQRNKVKSLAPVVDRWHTLDRLSAAQAVAAHAPGAQVMVQVNVTGEPTKSGCRLEDAGVLVEQLVGLGLQVRGLMTIGPLGPPEAARSGFRAVAALNRRLGLPDLSMGMSDDLEIAVAEGATMLRIGRALLGSRPPRPRSSRSTSEPPGPATIG